ncbi:hypothetical protein [Streptomyces sp. CAU 1734]|uniref:hypothetical protein n=1 Tax=Streptomyces sp. CAU 1734 TaxID=3140360 RepID=UPI00325FE2EF
MLRQHLTAWAVHYPWHTAALTAGALVLTATVLWWAIHTIRTWTWPPGSVLTAAAGAAVCTLYSGDTSWRFAETGLGMINTTERITMFAAGELALLACAVMARATKRATTTETTAGSPGVPGVLVWIITAVQVIPCYATSGILGGTVRATFGPVMAALLWHLAMGLEIRVSRPAALSTGLAAVLARELRQRLLSHLGIAAPDRTAAQITRDRATARAVRLAARPRLHTWGQQRLAAAVTRSGAATNPAQRHQLLQELAARRSAPQLATIALPSPWTAPDPAPDHSGTLLATAGAHLRTLHPMDAITHVHASQPTATPEEIASITTAHGVPVSPTQVGIALRATTRTDTTTATPDDFAELLNRARDLPNPTIRTLRSTLRIGQRKAEAIRDALNTPAPDPDPIRETGHQLTLTDGTITP